MELPRKIGPYKILLIMGRGGMGVVYAAERESDGTRVALKTLSLPHAWMLGGIRREIRALARIRHPGIVGILDEGVEEGLPWFAMELVLGQNLTEVSHESKLETAVSLEDTATGPPGRLTLIRRICSALAYLHGEGLVHRDLKPSNVLVRSDGIPVVIDFGLIARFAGSSGRESIEDVGRRVGTYAYMAPEQIRGELVDPRADLYSLGCILYEMVAARPPFGLEKESEVLLAHLYKDPSPPSRYARGVPPKLDALILKLLEKDPSKRMGHAEDVAAALAGLGAGNGMFAAIPRARPYLYRPALHGRGEAMGSLAEATARLLAGRAALVTIQAEAGLGKTRTLLSLNAELREQRIQIISTGCEPPDAHSERPVSALVPLLDVVVDHCRSSGAEAVKQIIGDRAAVLAELVPSIETLPGLEVPEPPEALEPEGARLRLLRAVWESLVEFAGSEPLVILIDDGQWADDLTVGFLQLLADSLGSERVLVVLAMRPEEAPSELTELKSTETIRLPPLPAGEVRAMVGDMLGVAAPPRGLLEFLNRAEGNPFLVAEYVRLAVERGLLEREAAGQWRLAGDEADEARTYEVLPVPDSVRNLLAARLEGLTPSATRYLECAAVIGLPASDAIVARVAGLQTREQDDAALELMSAGILEEGRNGRLRFVKEGLRVLAYERIDPEARSSAHGAAADALAGDASRLEDMAFHLERAGQKGKAAPIYLAAARRAAQRYLHHDAERLYRAYLSVQAPSEATVAARRELAENVLHVIGDDASARTELEHALREARRLGLSRYQAACLQALGREERLLGLVTEAEEHLSSAHRIWRREEDRRGEGQTLLELGDLQFDRRMFDEARGMFEAAQTVAAQAEAPQDEAAALGRLANVHAKEGRIPEARSLYRRALDLNRKHRQRAMEATNLENLASLYQRDGAYEEARDLHEAALAVARAIGARRLQGLSLASLAEVHEAGGRLKEAESLFESAIRVARECRDQRSLGKWLCGYARLGCRRGMILDATRRLREALDVFRALSDKGGAAVALSILGLCRQSQSNWEKASRIHRRAVAMAREAGEVQAEVHSSLRLGEIAIEEGRAAEAVPMIESSLRMAGGSSPVLEAFALILRCRTLRLAGDLAGAETAFKEAEGLIGDLGHLPLNGLLAAQRIHLLLARGEDPDDALTTLRAVERKLDVDATSELAQAFDRAEHSAEAAAEDLFRGERRVDLGDAVAAWSEMG